jgi:sulfatase maturation enzyme AslB (radical SAM superfamily)
MSLMPNCLRPWYGFEIDDDQHHWGRTRPCCWGLQYGADIENHRLDDIWNGPVFRAYRQAMLNGDTSEFCPAECPNMNTPGGDRSFYLGMLWRRFFPNHLHNMAELLLKKTLLFSRPLYLKLTPDLNCNMRCIMCYQDHEKDLRLNEWAMNQVIGILKTSQVLHLQGGEIFASAGGVKALERLSDLKPQPRVGIITNGSFPTAYSWELLRSLNISWITVSVDAATSAVYSRIRPQGRWEDICVNLKRLADLQGKMGFRLLLSFTLMSINYHEMPDIVFMAYELGCDVNFNPLVTTQDKLSQKLCLEPGFQPAEQVEEAFMNAIEAARKLRLPLAGQSALAMRSIWLGRSKEE